MIQDCKGLSWKSLYSPGIVTHALSAHTSRVSSPSFPSGRTVYSRRVANLASRYDAVAHMHMHMHMHTCTCTCAHAHAHMHMRTCTCAHAHARMHMRTCTCAHAHAHMHMRTCTFACTQAHAFAFVTLTRAHA